MGQWNIQIQGVGCHHNKDLPSDANRLAAELVKALRATGHSVEYATFTYAGGASVDNLASPDYLKAYEPKEPEPLESEPVVEVDAGDAEDELPPPVDDGGEVKDEG